MNIKKAWKDFWEDKHRHSYTHSAENVRHNKIIAERRNAYELFSEMPRIFKEDDRYVCRSVITFSNGCMSRKTGFGKTQQEAYKDWEEHKVYLIDHKVVYRKVEQ